MNEELQDRIVNLQTNINDIKTSQPIGGSNYAPFYQETEFSIPATNAGGKSYWVWFRGDVPLPLVDFTFTVKENGTVVIPRNTLTYGLNAPVGNSKGFYSIYRNWSIIIGQYTDTPPFDIFDAHNYAVLIGFAENPVGSIRVKCKSSCSGVLYAKEAPYYA